MNPLDHENPSSVRIELDDPDRPVEEWVEVPTSSRRGAVSVLSFIALIGVGVALLFALRDVDRVAPPPASDLERAPIVDPQPLPGSDAAAQPTPLWADVTVVPRQLVAVNDGWIGIGRQVLEEGRVGANPVFISGQSTGVWSSPGSVTIPENLRPLGVGRVDGRLVAIASRSIPSGGDSEIITFEAIADGEWVELTRTVVTGFPRIGGFMGDQWVALIDRIEVADSAVTQMRTRFLAGNIETGATTEISVAPTEFVVSWALEPDGLLAVIQRDEITGSTGASSGTRRIAKWTPRDAWTTVENPQIDEDASLLIPAPVDPATAVVVQGDGQAVLVDDARGFRVADGELRQIGAGIGLFSTGNGIDDPGDFGIIDLQVAMAGTGWLQVATRPDGVATELLISTGGSIWNRVDPGLAVRDVRLVAMTADEAILVAERVDDVPVLRRVRLAETQRPEATIAATNPIIRSGAVGEAEWSEQVWSARGDRTPGFVGLVNVLGVTQRIQSADGLDIDARQPTNLPFAFFPRSFGVAGSTWWVLGTIDGTGSALFVSTDALDWRRVELALPGEPDEIAIRLHDVNGDDIAVVAEALWIAASRLQTIGVVVRDGGVVEFPVDPCLRQVDEDFSRVARPLEADRCEIEDLAVIEGTVFAVHTADQAKALSRWSVDQGWQSVALLDPPPRGGSVQSSPSAVRFLGDEGVVVSADNRLRWGPDIDAPERVLNGRFVALSPAADVAVFETDTDLWVGDGDEWHRFPTADWTVEQVLAVDETAALVRGFDDTGPIVARLRAPTG